MSKRIVVIVMILGCAPSLLGISGCGSGVTQVSPREQARRTCEQARWFSGQDFDTAWRAVQSDRRAGFTEQEVSTVLLNVCLGRCGPQTPCFSDCTACSTAIVEGAFAR